MSDEYVAPVAESTHIEKMSKTNPSTSKIGEIASNQRKSIYKPDSRLGKLDAQVLLDTQSSGFASRVVKYYENSKEKQRSISNQSYKRPGDFPIVNLDKSELCLNERIENRPKISRISIAPPINVSNSASIRSAIFRTGKNSGETPLSNTLGLNASIHAPKPLPILRDDEPIIPPINDFVNNSIPNSLDALKEISRKRIHCDELDGEQKKQKADARINSYSTITNISKRAREQSSPTYCSVSNEAQNKRYKNNDILSSLSSSISFSSPRSSVPSEANSAQRNKLINDSYQLESQRTNQERRENELIPPKNADINRVGTSSSDLTNRPTTTQLASPVPKSISDGSVPKQQKQAKLTLFNKDYSTMPVSKKCDNDDEDDDNQISFITPKQKTTNLFDIKRHKNQAQSKLSMMLSFFRNEESRDEIDGVGGSKPKDNGATSKESEQTKPSVTIALTTSAPTAISITPTSTTVVSSLIPSEATQNASKTNETVTEVNTTTKTISAPAENVTTSSKPETEPKTTITAAPPPYSFGTSLAPKPAFEIVSKPPAVETSKPTEITLPAKPIIDVAKPFTLPASASVASEIKTSLVAMTTTSAPSIGISSIPSFSFGSSNTSVSSSTSGPALSTTQIPTFNFGAPKTDIASKKVEFNCPQINESANPTVPTSTFNFGSSIKQKSLETETTNTVSAAPAIFGANITNNAIMSSTTSTIPQLPQFGAINPVTTSSTIPANITISNAAAPTKNSMFSFGTPSSTNTTNSPIQTSSTNFTGVTTPSSFGNASFTLKTTQSQPSTFGSLATSTTQSGFSNDQFGSLAKPVFGTFGTPSTTATATMTPSFGQTTTASSNAMPNLFGSNTATKQVVQQPLTGTTTPSSFPTFGSISSQAQLTSPAFGNTPNLFGSSTIENKSAPSMASHASIFGSATNQSNANPLSTNSFSSAAPQAAAGGGFSFGQSISQPTNTQTPATTASQLQMFGGGLTTNKNSSFVFGQSNLSSQTSTQPTPGIFGSKPMDNNTNNNPLSNNNPLGASTTFGSSPSAFNFTAEPKTAPPIFGSNAQTEIKSPSLFSFQGTNNNAEPAPSNNLNSTFSFGSSNTTDAAKPFAFGAAPTSAPAAPAEQQPFSFNAPNANAPSFNFSAMPQQPQVNNIFSIAPGSGMTTSKTGRPMRTATRRIK